MLVKSHITFRGEASEALEFYKEVFDAKVTNLIRYKDVQSPEVVPDIYKERILNARLDFDDNSFNICDAAPNETLIIGNNIKIDLVFFDDLDIADIFGKLSEGGEIKQSLDKTFFLPNFGILVDKFGINWFLMQMKA